MNANRVAVIVIVGASLAAWMAAAVTSGTRDIPAPVVRTAPPIDVRGAELAGEIARLHDRLRPTASPRMARNVFRFSVPPPRPAPVGVPAAKPALTESLSETRPLPLKLIGMAEDAGANGPERTAIMSASGQLVFARAGDTVLARYRVVRISAEVVELADTIDNSILRLALK